MILEGLAARTNLPVRFPGTLKREMTEERPDEMNSDSVVVVLVCRGSDR